MGSLCELLVLQAATLNFKGTLEIIRLAVFKLCFACSQGSWSGSDIQGYHSDHGERERDGESSLS